MGVSRYNAKGYYDPVAYAVLTRAEAERKRKDRQACRKRRERKDEDRIREFPDGKEMEK